MRHVTDGELHAFLDGALDLLPKDRGEEVRDHIADCSVCRERLQDEEAIRSRAEAVLGDPALGEVALPTFEELRERAEAPGSGAAVPPEGSKPEVRYRGPLRGIPLAWAATVVLALGVGWMGGQVGRSLPSDQLFETPSSGLEDIGSPSAAPSSVEAGLSPDADAESSREGTGPAPALSEARESVGNPPPRSPAPEGAREAREPSGEEGGASPVQALMRSAAPGDAVERSLGLAADVSASMGEIPGLADESQTPRREMMKAAEVPGLTADSLENSLVVPGLKVVSVEWEGGLSGAKVLHIRQLLSPEDTLDLRYLGMLLGTDPSSWVEESGLPLEDASGGRAYANVLEAALSPGWHQVGMEWGRGLLVARAPIPEASLKALLKTLH